MRGKCWFVSILLLLSIMLAMPAYAGNVSVSFNLSNTGQRFQRNVNSKNTKTNADAGWVVNLSSITFKNCNNLSGTLGMAFLPLIYKSSGGEGAGYYAGSANPIWTKYEGRFDKAYSKPSF